MLFPTHIGRTYCFAGGKWLTLLADQQNPCHPHSIPRSESENQDNLFQSEASAQADILVLILSRSALDTAGFNIIVSILLI